MASQRIQYIDLAKGFCMFIIVMGHSNYSINIKGITFSIVPLFFVVSGYFFKYNIDWRSFTIKKINTLFIPFLFFYLASYLVFYILKFYFPNLLITDAKGILDAFNNRQFFNGPLWFLLDLLWSNFLFFAILHFTHNQFARIFCVILCGFCGWYLGNKGVFIPLFIDVSLTSLPFFALGFFIKQTNLLNTFNKWQYSLCMSFAFYIISYYIEHSFHQRLSLHYNIIEGWTTYLLSLTTVLTVLFMCKTMNKLLFFNYFGKNSLIILCVHHMIYRPLIFIIHYYPHIELNGFTAAILTVIISATCIPLFNHLLPWFVAKKRLIG